MKNAALKQTQTTPVIARNAVTKQSIPSLTMENRKDCRVGLRPSRNDEGDASDRLTFAKNFANELSKSRLREIKPRWTPEKRAKQAERTRQTRPWLHSTGPKTVEGRLKASQNRRKHPELAVYVHYMAAQRYWLRLLKRGLFVKNWQVVEMLVLEERDEGVKTLLKRLEKTLEKAGVETLDQLLKRVREKLSENGIENAALDARVLVSRGGNFSPENMIAGGAQPVSQEVIDRVGKFVDQRISGAPVSRIAGGREFWGLHFTLSKDTLDPRPDTEILVEKALEFARDFAPKNGGENTLQNERGKAIQKHPKNLTGKGLRILDLGTGSGCILLSLLHELPEATGIGVDLAPGAVEQARANAASLGLQNRAEFRVGSWFDPIKEGESFALIVSNPPYIPESDIPNLSKEVRNHDPILALDGGADGLDPYRLLFRDTKKFLECGGRALYEFGAGQSPGIQRLVDDSEATLLTVHPDLAGIPRVAELVWGESKK